MRKYKARYDWHYDDDLGVVGQTNQSEIVFETDEEDRLQVEDIAVSKIQSEEQQYGGALADLELIEIKDEKIVFMKRGL